MRGFLADPLCGLLTHAGSFFELVGQVIALSLGHVEVLGKGHELVPVVTEELIQHRQLVLIQVAYHSVLLLFEIVKC